MPNQVRLNPGGKIPGAVNDSKLVSDSVVGKLFAVKCVTRGDPFGSSNTAPVQNPSEENLRS
jgi:hypothetical protein